MSSTSDSVSLSSSSSGSMWSRENIGRRLEEGSVSPTAVVGRIPMEMITEVREDPLEEIAESTRDVDRDIVSLERVSVVDRVCHGQEGVADKFFYMYMCHFSQLHVRLSSDDFAIWATTTDNMAILGEEAEYKQAGCVYSIVQTLQGWVFQSGGEGGREDMNIDELSAVDREVVEVLMKFTDRLPTKAYVYNVGHMAQVGKKNLTLFQALRKENAVKAKAVGNTEVPNLQESLVEVHVHSDIERKAELSARPSRGKDVKKVRVALLGHRSSSGVKGPEAGLIELPEMTIRKDIKITMR
ncbi:hypothetical protein DEO72_LG3g812 [Vigna unguiculata]|uniref:Uncharacterized protein n=1 Tax=Vigna unguiculata TaxID=3917 RepID=A0A4D6LCI5_VIGUN|nr:hypothetical protein DEO72_LG3g812 [Vigna unguiculata]